jgi:hypothetical protein
VGAPGKVQAGSRNQLFSLKILKKPIIPAS